MTMTMFTYTIGGIKHSSGPMQIVQLVENIMIDVINERRCSSSDEVNESPYNAAKDDIINTINTLRYDDEVCMFMSSKTFENLYPVLTDMSIDVYIHQ